MHVAESPTDVPRDVYVGTKRGRPRPHLIGRLCQGLAKSNYFQIPIGNVVMSTVT